MKKRLTLKVAGTMLAIVTVLQMLPVYAEQKPSLEASSVVQAADEYHLTTLAATELAAYDKNGMPLENKTEAALHNKAVRASDTVNNNNDTRSKSSEMKQVASKKVASTNAKKQNSITVAGRTLTFSKKLNMRATAYTADPSENGIWGAVDALGNDLKLGTVAVDPKVIPLGTKLFITGYQFRHLPQGGYVATATDTGGAIKGNKIDLFVPVSKKTGNTFGVQQIQVYVLK